MPVDAVPDLLADIGEPKNRKRDTSCFAFTLLDDARVARLASLTKAGYERCKAEGLLG